MQVSIHPHAAQPQLTSLPVADVIDSCRAPPEKRSAKVVYAKLDDRTQDFLETLLFRTWEGESMYRKFERPNIAERRVEEYLDTICTLDPVNHVSPVLSALQDHLRTSIASKETIERVLKNRDSSAGGPNHRRSD